jgi:hypothetical protein
MILDIDDEEKWIGTTCSIAALAEAFEGCRGVFGFMVPVGTVHPKFRDEVRAAIEQIAPRPGEDSHQRWERRNREQWVSAFAPTTSGDLRRPKARGH